MSNAPSSAFPEIRGTAADTVDQGQKGHGIYDPKCGVYAGSAMATRDKTILQTQRLRLRTWEDGDADKINRLCNTEAVMRWLGGVQSREELLEDVDYFQQCQEEDGHTFWVMERKPHGAFLGFCGLVIVVDEDSTVEGELEIGWRLRADEWGKGYAHEAATATLAYAFRKLGAERVVSRTAEGNQRSQRLMVRLGMSRRPELDYDPADGSDRLLVYDIAPAERPKRHANDG